MTIIYDGTYTLGTIQSNVEAAINDYISNLEFDSKFNTNMLVDKLQAIAGVIDPRFDEGRGQATTGIEIVFQHEYLTSAGWATINVAAPLSSTITYIAQ